MNKVEKQVSCCNLINFLGKLNKELGSTKLATEEFIKLIYCFLEKQEYLCQKCS